VTTRDDILERLSLAASYPWGPIRSSLTAEAVACGITLHHVAAYEIEDTPVPRWCLTLLAVTTAAGAVTAIGALPPGATSLSHPTAELTITIGACLCVLAPLLSTSRMVLLGLASTGAVAAGSALAHHLIPSPDSPPTGPIVLGGLFPTSLMLILMPLATRWSFAILSSVRAQEDLDLMRADLAVAQERLRIARDLHDTVAKSAAGMRMLAEVLHDSLEEEHSPHAADAALLLEAADALTSESRAVLDELRTTPDGDLRRRLAHDAETWGRRLDLPVDIVIEGVPVEADDALTWHAQRALGEMLSNVENHARAESVTIRVAGVTGAGTEPLRFLVEVEDDGIGLPRRILEDPSNLRGSGHYGLCGVQERLASMGGRLSLRAREAGGTRIRATIPVRTTPSDEGSTSSAIEGGSYASTDR